MTSLDRAKSFLKSKVKQTALIVLPLAAATIQAHAAVVFTGAGNFNTSGSSLVTVVSGAANQEAIGPYNGTTGLKFWSSGGVTFTYTSSGGTVSQCPTCYGLSASGGASPNLFETDQLVIGFNFTLTDSNNLPIFWEVRSFLNAPGFVSLSGSGTTAAGGETVSGSLVFSGLSGLNVSSWGTFIDVSFVGNFAANDTITLDIPHNSLDLGAVPEPATWSLLLGGGALIGWFRRKRRVQ